MEEIWKDIPGYEGRYQASTMGRIKSLDRYVDAVSKNGKAYKFFKKGRVLRPGPNTNGYLGVNLSKYDHFCVHHLVACTFIGPRPSGMEVMHLDGNRLNNTAENLAYGTHTENEKDKRIKHHDKLAKLSHSQVQEIRRLFKTTKLSNVKIAKMYGVSDVLISSIRRGVAWKNLPDES